MYDLIWLVNVEKTSWKAHNGLPTFQPIYPFFESLRPFWTLKKLSDPNENLHSWLYLEKEHFPYRADINIQKSPFSTYPNIHPAKREHEWSYNGMKNIANIYIKMVQS